MFLEAVLTMGGIALFLGLGLVISDRLLRITEDSRLRVIEENLPGINCGACGFAGCGQYAQAILEGKVSRIWCAAAGVQASQKIAGLLGMSAEEESRVAVVQCQGDSQVARDRGTYYGVKDCEAALLVSGGHKACEWGCLGLGTCKEACPFEAIHMLNGLPVIDEGKCTACGNCVTACPRGIITLIPRKQMIYLACLNQKKGKDVKQICSRGCFACLVCVSPKVAPEKSIVMKGNLPVIKNRFSSELALAREKCPAHCYVARP